MRTEGQKERQIDRYRNRQTDMKKLIVAFHNFANTPKKESSG
jgi:3-dehydroquinate dehydratase